MQDKEVSYLIPDFRGYPTRVRASEVEAFLARQEELKKNPPKQEDLASLVEQMLAEMEAEDGITPPEENLF
jgi:hypothetical protein